MSTPIKAACEQHRPGPAARNAARLGGRIPVIDTRRLQLRGPRIYDFDAFAQIMCSERAVHMGGPLSRAEAWAEFTNYTACWLLHGHGLWTIDAQVSPSAGFVLLGFEYDDPEPELGVFLTEAVEGQGIAFEAMEAARDHAFTDLKWDSVVSFVAPENTRCRALMDRMGARSDGDLDGTMIYRHDRGAV